MTLFKRKYTYEGHTMFRNPALEKSLMSHGSNRDRVALSDKLHIDWNRTPHVLIAGSTGYGKSVLLHSIILGICYGNSPKDARFIFIDPKMVEFNRYRTLPHRTLEPATDIYSAFKALEYAEGVMKDRYRKLKATGMNQWQGEILYVVIDEVAQLIFHDKSRAIRLLSSLTSLGRAAGVRVIAATQMPTKAVLSNQVLVNFDARICLHLDDSVAYRTVLGTVPPVIPSEKGEAIYKAGSDLYHLYAPYTSEEDYEFFLENIKINGKPYNPKKSRVRFC